ncbi:hypothetical protein [Enterococcus sp. LJL90]
MHTTSTLENTTFQEFLTTPDRTLFCEVEQYLLYKVDAGYPNARFDYLFSQRNDTGIFFPHANEWETSFLGLYDHENNHFYLEENFTFDYYFKQIQKDKFLSYDGLMEDFCYQFRTNVLQIVAENKLYFLTCGQELGDLEECHKQAVQAEIEASILIGTARTERPIQAPDFSHNSKLFLDTLCNQDALLHQLAFEYVTEHKDQLVQRVLVEEFSHWYERSLQKNEVFQQKVALFESVRDSDKKTVMIDYQKGGKAFTFKVENQFNAHMTYLSTYSIVSPKDRQAFKELFGYEDIQYEHITAVYYRKQQLFPPLSQTA